MNIQVLKNNNISPTLRNKWALPTKTTDLISSWVKDYGELLERFDALVSE